MRAVEAAPSKEHPCLVGGGVGGGGSSDVKGTGQWAETP